MRYWMEATNYVDPMMGRDYFLNALDRTRSRVELQTLIEMASKHKLHFFGPTDTPLDYKEDYPGIEEACQVAREIGTYHDDMPCLHMYDETTGVVQSATRMMDFIWDSNSFVRYTALKRNLLMEFTESKEDYLHAREVMEQLIPDPELKEFTELVHRCIQHMAEVSHLKEKELASFMKEATEKAAVLSKKSKERPALIMAHAKAKAICYKLETEDPKKPFMGYEITAAKGIVFYRDGLPIEYHHDRLQDLLKV